MPDLIIVDLETTGLDPDVHVPVEIAAMNTRTGEAIRFVPHFTAQDLADADEGALAINHFWRRDLCQVMRSVPETTNSLVSLGQMLRGNVVGGSNPAFDVAFLTALYLRHRMTPPSWHYRLADISPITAGALGLDPTDLPGLARCCELLGVRNLAPHTALGDVIATAECFGAVQSIGSLARAACGGE